jgi:hypothetical protein
MKSRLIFATLIFACLTLSAKNKTIINPICEFQKNGICKVTLIECNEKETRLTLRIKLAYEGWYMFNASTFIKDPTLQDTLYLRQIVGMEIGHKVYMPKNADSTVTLIFPSIDEQVKKLDFGENGKVDLYGIRLDPKQKASKEQGVPGSVLAWIKQETYKDKLSPYSDFELNHFFRRDTARIVGYINGYDIRSDLTSSIIYLGNAFTRESTPIVVHIQPNGRFETNIPLAHPVLTETRLADKTLTFYLEPGSTLGVILEWKNLLQPEKNLFAEFYGALASVNSDLQKIQLQDQRYMDLLLSKPGDPMLFKAKALSLQKEQLDRIDSLRAMGELSPKTSSILKYEVYNTFGYLLLNMIMMREGYTSHDTANKALQSPEPIEYYDFLQKYPLGEPGMSISRQFSFLINRLEYNHMLIGKDWIFRDSLYFNRFKLKNDFTYQVIKTRYLNSNISSKNKTQADYAMKNSLPSLNIPFLIEETNRLYAKYYPVGGIQAYELPQTDAGILFKKMIEPFNGKYLFVDFWATTCGPCISNIREMKETRSKYATSREFVFLFITGDDQTPVNDYNTFVADQNLTNSWRISQNEFDLLMELFRFSGIPHYVLVDPEGKIMDDSYEILNFKRTLNELKLGQK